MKDNENAVFNEPTGEKKFKVMQRFIRCRYNNGIRQRYCADKFGWEKPARLQLCNGPEEHAAQIPAVVHWHNKAATKGIENTFMRFSKEEGDNFLGAVVFDLSYKKFNPVESNKIRQDE